MSRNSKVRREANKHNKKHIQHPRVGDRFRLLEIGQPDPSYHGLFLSFAQRKRGVGLYYPRVQQVSTIVPTNALLPGGRRQRVLVFRHDDAPRIAFVWQADSTASLTATLSGEPLHAGLLTLVSSLANELKEQFPGNPDNKLCFLVDTRIRDSEVWDSVGIEYGLGTAPHEQFWSLFDQRFAVLLSELGLSATETGTAVSRYE